LSSADPQAISSITKYPVRIRQASEAIKLKYGAVHVRWEGDWRDHSFEMPFAPSLQWAAS
jgi:hypothetical protein